MRTRRYSASTGVPWQKDVVWIIDQPGKDGRVMCFTEGIREYPGVLIIYVDLAASHAENVARIGQTALVDKSWYVQVVDHVLSQAAG